METATFYRLIVPEAALFSVIPLVAVGMLLQIAHLAGVLRDLDVELYAYFISGGYVFSILVEARQIYREKTGR